MRAIQNRGPMQIQKHFEVKTGKNKGFYIVTKAKHLEDEATYKEMANIYGILPYEYNSDFYRYHHINPNIEIVWTHTRFAGHEFSRNVYHKLLEKFGCLCLLPSFGLAY